jgi:hypothetical protein
VNAVKRLIVRSSDGQDIGMRWQRPRLGHGMDWKNEVILEFKHRAHCRSGGHKESCD